MNTSERCGNGTADAEDYVPVQILAGNERTEKLRKLFAALYKQEPDFYVRVPGRVNLIGEHIDYCGYGVCPMALQQDILLAVAPNDGQRLRLANLDERYEDHDCDMRHIKVDVECGGPCWYKYFQCGVKGILEVLPKDMPIVGMNVAVTGNIPPSAGLSSSSAMVSAAALATTHAHKFSLPKQKIATLSAECERYIGTQGGGMDQAIAFLASEGCAKFIEFAPLRSQDVALPKGAVFVIAHSLAELNKAATAHFNCRVVECRLATQILANKHGLAWRRIAKLAELQAILGVDLQSMCETVEKSLHEEPYTKEEVCRELGISEQTLDVVSLTPNTRHIQKFKLRQRAQHVFEEALRVQQFCKQCESASSSDGSLACLGQLMLDSHRSLRDLYECSHDQLDRVVELAADTAFGARLTGAGWGGCVVALLSAGNVDAFIGTLKEKFYAEHGVRDGFSALVFATAPNAGASIFYMPSERNGGN